MVHTPIAIALLIAVLGFALVFGAGEGPPPA